MTQRTNIIIVVLVALIALVLWSVPHFLPESEAPTGTPSEAPPADDGAEVELPDAPVEEPERPDFTDSDTPPDLSEANRATADGLYRDLKSAADSIGEARDQVRFKAGTLTLENPKRAEGDTVEGEKEETEESETDPEP